MPNFLGLLTKQEAKELRDLNLSGHRSVIIEIAEMIKSSQLLAPEITEITLNRVVHTDVEKFYKNTMAYLTEIDSTGQPANFTLLTKISWL